MSKFIEPLSDLLPSRYLLRTLAIVAFIILLLAAVPWSTSIVARILGSPDLRHSVDEGIALSNGERFYRITVINMGLQRSQNVYVDVRARNSAILGFSVISQEQYELKTADRENGLLTLTLPRLAPGAAVIIELRAQKTAAAIVSATATDDFGISRPIDRNTLSQQMADYSTKTKSIFAAAASALSARLKLTSFSSTTNQSPFIQEVAAVTGESDFKSVGLAALIVVLLLAAFFPEQSRLPIALISAGFVALFFNPPISGWVPATGAVVLGLLLAVRFYGRNRTITFIIALITIIVAFILMALSEEKTVQGRWYLAAAAFFIAVLVTPVPVSERAVTKELVGALQNQISYLESRINSLEKMLQQSQATGEPPPSRAGLNPWGPRR